MRRPVGAMPSVLGTIIPVYCAQCGMKWGMVPEKGITFAFVLCNECAETMGPIAHTYSEPDAVFWRRIEAAQQEAYGRLLNADELIVALDKPDSLESKLAAEWRAHLQKAG